VRSVPVLNDKIFKTIRPTIGLRLGPVPDEGKGVLVRSVIPGSLAEQAGLLAEDVILAVDEVRFNELSGARAVQSMRRAISRDDTGTSVRIEYLRGGEINITDTRTQTTAEIARLRESMPADQNSGKTSNQRQALSKSNRRQSSALDGGAVIHWSGLTFVNMTPALGSYFGVESGVLLVHTDGSLPLAEGDVILKIGQQDLVNATQAVNLLQAYDRSETMTFEIWRYRQSIRLEFAFNASTPETGRVLLSSSRQEK
jgi:S1-C subfamily serine protease